MAKDKCPKCESKHVHKKESGLKCTDCFHEWDGEMSDITIEQAMNIIRKAIQEDVGYRIGWQANIAMAFRDEYARRRFMSEAEHIFIHGVANKAAKNFLDILVMP